MPMDVDDGPITLGDPKGLAPVDEPLFRHQRAARRKSPGVRQAKRAAGSKAVETGVKVAIAISLADGPLPIGDTVAAVGLVAIGAYLILSD